MMYDFLFQFLFGDGSVALAVIDPVVGSAIIAGGASLIGSLFSSGSSANTANKNLQMQREQNEANLKLAQYQNDWNLEQWKRENAYNTPTNQLTRYKAAGINPYMALGQVSAGNTTAGLQSSDMVSGQHAPQLQQTVPMAAAASDGVAQMASLYNQALQATQGMRESASRTDKNRADTQGKNIENFYADSYLANRNAQALEDLKRKESDNKAAFKWNDWLASDEYLANARSMSNLSVQEAENYLNNLGADAELKMIQQKLLEAEVVYRNGQIRWQDVNNMVDMSYKIQKISESQQQMRMQWDRLALDKYATYQGVAQKWASIRIDKANSVAYIKLTGAQKEYFDKLAAKTFEETHKLKNDNVVGDILTTYMSNNKETIISVKEDELAHAAQVAEHEKEPWVGFVDAVFGRVATIFGTAGQATGAISTIAKFVK